MTSIPPFQLVHSLLPILSPLLLLLLLTHQLVATNLTQFDEPRIWEFVRGASKQQQQQQRIGQQCADSLARVETYLTDKGTLREQRDFFSEAFSMGDGQQFISRDQDRWLFNAFKCIKAAGESSYSASEYPLHYCYGKNHPLAAPGEANAAKGRSSENDGERSSTTYGMCIPSTCSGQTDRLELLREWQRVASNGTDQSPIHFGDCTKSRHAKQWWEQPIPLVHFGSDLVLIALVGVATALHWRRSGIHRGRQQQSLALQLLLSFSAKLNVQKLVQMPKDRMNTITCFFGLRFGAMVWTLIGHSFIFVQAFLANVDAFKDDLVDNFWNQWITNFTLSVDVFLVLSGTLTAYSWFRRWNQPSAFAAAADERAPGWTSWAYWLRFYRHRVIRLWPAYIYTLIAMTTRVSITHYHPMWPPTDPAVQCPKHWWENVLFLNSLTDNRCMPWTWYIGTEFLFYVVSPIFLLSLRQSPRVGVWLCAICCILSAVFNAVTMHRYNFPPTQMLWRQPPNFSADFIQHHLIIYIKPWYRIGPYLVGLVLGYVLAMHSLLIIPQQQNNNTSKLSGRHSRRFVYTGWALASAAGFWSVFGLYPALQGWDWPVYHLFYGAVSRTVFALALGWLIYACHTGIGGPLNWLLNLSPLLPLSNLSYTAYLFHMVPVVFTYVVSPFPMHFDSKWQILGHCCIQLAISYCYGKSNQQEESAKTWNDDQIYVYAAIPAILCTLLAELPALNIERILLAGSGNNNAAPSKSAMEQKMVMLNGNGISTACIDGVEAGGLVGGTEQVCAQQDGKTKNGCYNNCATLAINEREGGGGGNKEEEANTKVTMTMAL